jgi:hypothetical protein
VRQGSREAFALSLPQPKSDKSDFGNF